MTERRVVPIAIASALGIALVIEGGAARAQEEAVPPPPEVAPEPAEAAPAPSEAAPAPAAPPVVYVQPAPTPASTAWAPGPAYAPYAPPPAPEPVVRERLNWALVAGGAATFAGGWLITWIATVIWYDRTTSCTSTGWWGYTCTHYGPDDTALGWSFAPLIGPWLMLTSQSMRGADMAFPIIAGVVQAGGLALLIVGLTTRERVGQQPVVSARLGSDPRAPSLSFDLTSNGLSFGLTHH